jgi:hypothetical protein
MSTSHVSAPSARAVDLAFTDDALVLRLRDGRVLSVPLAWFPSLRDATKEQRSGWHLIGDGIGFHWPELDEDISVAGLLGLPD